MLRGRDNFALYFELLISPGLNKPVVPTILLYPITERGGLLGLEQGYHHLPATSQSVGVSDNYVARSRLDTTSTLYRTNPSPGQDLPSLSGVLS